MDRNHACKKIQFILASASAVLLMIHIASRGATVAGEPFAYADVAPIFQKNCIICHSGDGPPRGLRLDTCENIRKGSDRGPVVAPGDPENSELVRRIKGISQPRMPFDGRRTSQMKRSVL